MEGYAPDRYYDMWKHPEKHAAEDKNGATMSGMEQNESLVKITKSQSSLSISPVVNSKEYHDAFEAMPFPKPVAQSVYEQTGRILGDVDGTEFERLVAVDARTGKLVADSFGREPVERKSWFVEDELAEIEACPHGVVLIHNHPRSADPSYTDIVTAAKQPSVKASVVLGHDGSVWYLSIDDAGVADRLESYYNALKGIYGRYAKGMAVDDLLTYNDDHHIFEWKELR